MPGEGRKLSSLAIDMPSCECFSAIEAELIGTVPRLVTENPVINLWGHHTTDQNQDKGSLGISVLFKTGVKLARESGLFDGEGSP